MPIYFTHAANKQTMGSVIKLIYWLH